MFVIVVVGDAGVGKTTFGRRLARSEGAVLVDLDTCTQATVDAGLTAAGMRADDRDSPSYKALFRLPVHEALFAITRDQLWHAGLNCVLVAPFTAERQRADFIEFLHVNLALASSLASSLKVFVIHCVCDPLIRRQRIITRYYTCGWRGLARDAAKFRENVQYFQLQPSQPLLCQHLRIDTTFDSTPPLTGPWSYQSSRPAKL